MLVPRIERMPMFMGSAPAENRRRQFEAYGCAAMAYYKETDVPEVCKDFYKSISAYVNNGGYGNFFGQQNFKKIYNYFCI